MQFALTNKRQQIAKPAFGSNWTNNIGISFNFIKIFSMNSNPGRPWETSTS